MVRAALLWNAGTGAWVFTRSRSIDSKGVETCATLPDATPRFLDDSHILDPTTVLG